MRSVASDTTRSQHKNYGYSTRSRGIHDRKTQLQLLGNEGVNSICRVWNHPAVKITMSVIPRAVA